MFGMFKKKEKLQIPLAKDRIKIKRLLQEGNKVEAIRYRRGVTGESLKKAKGYVDDLQEQLKRNNN